MNTCNPWDFYEVYNCICLWFLINCVRCRAYVWILDLLLHDMFGYFGIEATQGLLNMINYVIPYYTGAGYVLQQDVFSAGNIVWLRIHR